MNQRPRLFLNYQGYKMMNICCEDVLNAWMQKLSFKKRSFLTIICQNHWKKLTLLLILNSMNLLRVHPYVRLFERRRITLSILRDSLVYFLDEYAIKFDFYLINILHIIYTCSCKNFFPKSSGIKGFLNFKNFFRIFSKKKYFQNSLNG